MPTTKLVPRPGINTQRSQTLNMGGWSISNLMRFREGLPENVGGWVMFIMSQLQGVCRALWAWTTLLGSNLLAAGTSLRLYVISGGSAFDITPVVLTTTPTNPFTTQNGQTLVTVNDPSVNTLALSPNSFIEVSGSTPVGGLTISGEYSVVSVLSGTSYTFNAATPATSGATGGGTPTIQYLLPSGGVDSTPGVGYGVGPYGAGTYSSPRSPPVQSQLQRLWTLDNWGEDLIANPRGWGIYQWLPSGGTGTRAALLSGAPTVANAILVASPAQILIAFGCSPPAGGAQDNMLIAWSDLSNNTSWTPLSTNQAGSFRLTDGSQIMIAHRIQLMLLVHTDTALYSMQYSGYPFIFDFNQVGANCGLVAPNAAAFLGDQYFWMGLLNFWMFSGTAMPIDCAVRDVIFKNINQAQISKTFAAVNSQWGEIWWFYCSATSNEIDSYVILNVQAFQNDPTSAWAYGSLSRTAWIDGNVFGDPIAADPSGNLWSHEAAYTAGGASMPFAIESGYTDIEQGEEYYIMDLVVPDQKMSGGPVAYWFKVLRYTGDTPQVYGPFPVYPSTEFITFRARGRQMAFRVDNSFNAVGVSWRMGAARARVAPDGRL